MPRSTTSRLVIASLLLAALAAPVAASYLRTPVLYTDGTSAVTCTVMNLAGNNANGNPVRLWVLVQPLNTPNATPESTPVPFPTAAPTPESQANFNKFKDTFSYGAYYYCGKLAQYQTCSTPPIVPSAGRAVTCAVDAYGVA